MQVAEAELAHVREPGADALERAGEAVGVRDVAGLGLALEPVGRDLALVVEPAQARLARRGGLRHGVGDGVEAVGEARVRPVQAHERLVEVGEVAGQPHAEDVVSPRPLGERPERVARRSRHVPHVLHGA